MYYYLLGNTILWSLTLNTSLGVLIAAPISAYFVKKISEENITKLITTIAIIMGLSIIIKAWNLILF
jgi:uncharacterized membrane protein YfcA